jgi:hypothetical protein
MTVLLDAAGRRRSPVTMPGYHAGRPPGNKGMTPHREAVQGVHLQCVLSRP